MRKLVLLLLLAGCDTTVPAQRDLAISWCADECGTCGAGETCLRWAIIQPRAACVRSCTVTQDCPSDFHCLEIDRTVGPMPNDRRFCVPKETCLGDSMMCTPPQVSSCRDDNTLARHFQNGSLCGYELIDCPNGCDPHARPDMGGIPNTADCR